MTKPRLISAFLLLALIFLPFVATRSAYADCAGSATNVDCTGVDPDGWDASIEAPGASTTVTVHPGAEVQDTLILEGSDTLNVDSGGAITVNNAYGVLAVNTNTIDNEGTIAVSADSTQAFAVASFGDGAQITNSGALTAQGNLDGADGAFIVGDHTQIANSGTVEANGAIWAGGVEVHGQVAAVANSGTIDVCGTAEGYGLYVQSEGGQITNSGTINASSAGTGAGIVAYGDGVQVTNDGTVDVVAGAAGYGLYAEGDGLQIANAGEITASGGEWGVGIEVQGSGIRVTNSGTLAGNGYALYAGGSGTQAVRNSGTLDGDVRLGGGADSFAAEGGAVDGLLDGGDDYDVLSFEMIISAESWESAVAALAQAHPEGGTIVVAGATYTWTNFEDLRSLIQLLAFHDRRLNDLDFAATAIVYRLAGGVSGVELYTPVGDWAFRAEAEALIVALAQAAASGAPVEVASRLGIALYAMPDGSLFATGPGYAFAFEPYRCGLDG